MFRIFTLTEITLSKTMWGADFAAAATTKLQVQERQETRIHSLGQGDPLQEEMLIHSSILA